MRNRFAAQSRFTTESCVSAVAEVLWQPSVLQQRFPQESLPWLVKLQMGGKWKSLQRSFLPVHRRHLLRGLPRPRVQRAKANSGRGVLPAARLQTALKLREVSSMLELLLRHSSSHSCASSTTKYRQRCNCRLGVCSNEPLVL